MHTQINNLLPYWPKKAEWFIIGGPARENEAQAVKKMFPHVKCIGFEPNKELFQRQLNGDELFYTEQKFPGPLFPYALWNRNTELTLNTPNGGIDPARSSVCRPADSPDVEETSKWNGYKVQGRTLDSLSEEHGPFNNAVLWLDIEYAELAALEGAASLLDRTLLLNLETFAHLYLPDINKLLLRHGLVLQKVWNIGQVATKDAQDYIYARN